MPWKETTLVSTREEFVRLATGPDANVSQLCDRFGISRKTGYKWIDVYRRQGLVALGDRSRRPHSSPNRIDAELERVILEAAEKHPAWGARKLHSVLMRSRSDLPAVSTVQAVLDRNGRVCAAKTEKHQAVKRFEHPEPNDLWQMDFKCDIPCRQQKAMALTVLDDHSRFSICLRACLNQRTETVQEALTDAFRLYGLPHRMTMDNGSPWGDSYTGGYTRLTIWLVKLGVAVSHSRPYHPQTQGKDERFHRTLKVELLQFREFASQAHLQKEFDNWRDVYNTIRPHEGIQMQTPIDRYRTSNRLFPETIPAVEYDSNDHVRKVSPRNTISYNGLTLFIGNAFSGEYVAVRKTSNENIIEVYFATHLIHTFDLKTLRKQ